MQYKNKKKGRVLSTGHKFKEPYNTKKGISKFKP
jgi:hypothetical protein